MRRNPLLRSEPWLATALCVVLAAACAPLEVPGNEVPPPAEPAVTISPTSGPAGSEVTVHARGFPASTGVEIGVGPPNAWYDEIAQGTTDGDGELHTRVTMPSLDAGRDYVFVVRETGVREGARAVSEPFRLTEESGS